MREAIASLVAEGKLRQALDALAAAAQRADEHDLVDDLATLGARLSRLTRDEQLGTKTSEAADAERAKLARAILSFARELPTRSPDISDAPSVNAAASSSTPAARGPFANQRPLPVFVSYAHADTQVPGRSWLDLLQTYLRPLVREGLIDLFVDDQLRPSADWDAVLDAQLARTRIAVLMISADLLASDYVSRTELPVLLERRRRDELRLLMLVLSPCDLAGTRFHFPDPVAGPHSLTLDRIQALHPLNETLQQMPEERARTVLVQLVNEIRVLVT